MVRMAVQSVTGVARITVLCDACASELAVKARQNSLQIWIRDYLIQGDCEVCRSQIVEAFSP